jgi:hypothetical protein
VNNRVSVARRTGLPRPRRAWAQKGTSRTIKTSSKISETTRATQFIAGIAKHLVGVTSVTFSSAAHTPADLTTAFQTLVSLRAAVIAAQAAEKAKLSAESAQRPAILVLLDGFEAYVKLTYSEQADVLADFGLAPKKPRPKLTAAQQAAATAKRNATRAARGTKGSKQKKSVKGAVTGVEITPVTSAPQPASPVAPSAPANTGSAAGGTASKSA